MWYFKHHHDIPFYVQIDQPDLGLPLAMYSDEESYATYIKAYKQYMVDVATILVSCYKSGILRDKTMADTFLYIPNDDIKNYHLCRLQLVVERFGHLT